MLKGGGSGVQKSNLLRHLGGGGGGGGGIVQRGGGRVFRVRGMRLCDRWQAPEIESPENRLRQIHVEAAKVSNTNV